MPSASPEISVVVPLYNESGNLQPLLQEIHAALQGSARSYEVLFIDDGSSDDTWRLIVALSEQDPRLRGVRHAGNAGQSAALWSGLIASRGSILATLDGDLQNDPAEFPRMLQELESCDMVCGMRVKRQDSWLRRVSSWVARWARRAALGSDFQDTGCALRVFRRQVLDSTFPFNGLHRFLPILVAGGGYRVREIPVNHRPRHAGVSKYGVWNRALRGLVDLFGVGWFLRRRLKGKVAEGIPPATH